MSDHFPTTRWTLLRKLRSEGGPTSDVEAKTALEYLCTCYWRPIRNHLVMLGKSDEEAKDLTQGFFAHLIEKNVFARADRDRGRLRTFLLSALNQYVIGEWRRETAAKRGGEAGNMSLDAEAFPSPSNAADDLKRFDRAWAEQVFDRSLLALERAYRGRGKEKLIHAIGPHLGSFDESAAAMEPLARELGITLPALRVHLHRARKRFGDCLRDELRALQTAEEEIEDELRYLVSLLDE